MADAVVGDSSTSENGNIEYDAESPKLETKNKTNCEKNETQTVVDNLNKNEGSEPSISVTNASSSPVSKSEVGLKLNNNSPLLRPSVLGGNSPSTSSSSSTSLFGSSPNICSPLLSSSANNFPRNLFSKSSLSCTKLSENRSPVFQKPVLRPSQLANSSLSESTSPFSKSSNPFVLNPPKLANPFAKQVDNIDEPSRLTSGGDNSVNKEENNAISNLKTQENNVVTPSAAGQQGQQQQQLDCSKTATTASVAFVPLSTPSGSPSTTPLRLAPTSSSTHTTTPNVTPGGFVFGQNLHERVIVEPTGSEASTSSLSDIQNVSLLNDGVDPSIATATTNGTSTEMLFSSVIQKELPEKSTEGNGNVEDKSKKSLSESAREYEESRAVKRKYEEVAVVTGEEEENNILQMDCKLFVYDGSKFNYSEGVHGSLRVNDPTVSAKKVTQSRVIVRMSGTLRVLMNTKIWAGMKIEKPNRKIVRMTAMDSKGQIKVFLISSSPSESDMLYRVLETRIKLQKDLTGACRNGNLDETDKTTSASSECSQ